jgi:hypothetical protein
MKNTRGDWEVKLAENHFSMWSNWDRRMSYIVKREKRLVDFIHSLIEKSFSQGYNKGREEVREWATKNTFEGYFNPDTKSSYIGVHLDELLDFLKKKEK